MKLPTEINELISAFSNIKIIYLKNHLKYSSNNIRTIHYICDNCKKCIEDRTTYQRIIYNTYGKEKRLYKEVKQDCDNLLKNIDSMWRSLYSWDIEEYKSIINYIKKNIREKNKSYYQNKTVYEIRTVCHKCKNYSYDDNYMGRNCYIEKLTNKKVKK